MGRILLVMAMLLPSIAHAECDGGGGPLGFLKSTFDDVRGAVRLGLDTFEIQTPDDLLPWNRGGNPGTPAKLAPCDESRKGLKVMSYNIRSTRESDMNHIAREINAQAPDFVALQEVDVGAWRTGRRDQPKELAKRTGLEHHAFVGTHRNFFIDQYGNAILSKYQIVETRRYYLPSSPAEQRMMICAKVKAPAGETIVCNTHLGLNQAGMKDERIRQVKEIQRIVSGFDTDRVVLMGDLNEKEDGPAMQLLARNGWRDAWKLAGRGPGNTSTPANPNKRIDYILLAPGMEGAGCASVPKVNGSDHLPVVTTVY